MTGVTTVTGVVDPSGTRSVALVRLATEEDLPVLVRLEAALFPDAWSPASLTPYVSGERNGAYHHRLAWIAEADGAVRGYLLASWVLDEGTVERVGVAPEHRRRGIGRALLDHCLAALAGRGIREVWLEVAASNEAALHLYENAGFVLVSRRRGYYAGPPPEDALVMKKAIS